MSQSGNELNRFSYHLPTDLKKIVTAEVDRWAQSEKLKAEWTRDSSVWTQSGEEKWLDWLNVPVRELQSAEGIERFAKEVSDEGFRHVVLLGMGGSSLCAEVIEKSFGRTGVENGFPTFRILDSTDPIQIRNLEEALSLEDTLFIVSSKSGGTLEPNILFEYFFHRVSECVGKTDASSHFVAITDPASSLETLAKEYEFKRIFHGDPGIGGRYSVLSDFGMVPAALMGVKIKEFLERTLLMVHSCGPSVPPAENPGVLLGAILGTLGKGGRDKITIVCSNEIEDFGSWLEQLLAESTGKQGRGLIPIVREQILGAEEYGSDRVFVYIRSDWDSDAERDSKITALEKAGQPVIRIFVSDIYNLGQEFFRWEAATAVAGSILGINPFDQPDVEASKVETRKLTAQYEKTGQLPTEVPIFKSDDIEIFADQAHAEELKRRLGATPTVSDYLRAHFNRITAGDYFAILAYIPMNQRDEDLLQGLRTRVLKTKKVATCVEFGPRFLHSTGQVYKGGPNSGVFLQITSHDVADLMIPGHRYTFGIVKAAEARGDLAVLTQRNRRVLRVHLRRDPDSGLKILRQEVEKAVA